MNIPAQVIKFIISKSIVEALDIGIEEYLDSGHYCMIEWPEIIKPLLPENALFIEITAQADKSRKVQILSTKAA